MERNDDILRLADTINNSDTRWRRFGQARRRELLEKDRRQGGMVFTMNPSCGIDRYYLVSQRALEQFRRMFDQADADPEEVYIMGNRIVCFLAEYLPKHPHYVRRETAEIRLWSVQEMEWMKESLEEIALRIDEEQLNKFVTVDFDPIPDDESECSVELAVVPSNSSDPNTEDPSDLKWDPFDNWKQQDIQARREVDSPTVETVGTTGTGSIAIDETSSEDSDRDFVRHHSRFDLYEGNNDEPSSPRYVFRLDAEFLERIAREKVRYETDSEAVDSWAQDGESLAMSASSGADITYDPARIALREVFNRIPRSAPSPVKEEESALSSSVDSSGSVPIESSHSSATRGADLDENEPASDKENGFPLFDSDEEMKKSSGTGFESFGPFVTPELFDQEEWVSFDIDDSSVSSVPFGSVWKG